MKDVVYVGTAGTRSLSELDFERMGVTHKAVDFAKGVPAEVSNELADALLENILVRREFALADETNTYPVKPETPMPRTLVQGSVTALTADPAVTSPVSEQSVAGAEVTDPGKSADDESGDDKSSGASKKEKAKPKDKADA